LISGQEFPRSYFDTTLGYAFFNVPAATVPEVVELLTAARRDRKLSSERRDEFLHGLMGWVRLRHYPLLAHEWGHSLQVLTHPALFLRCLREFSAVCSVADELRKAPYATPLRLFPDASWVEGLVMPTIPVRLSVNEDGEPAAEPATARTRRGDLSEADLLEDSASIFQYKAEIGSEGSVDGYRRWLGEGRKYLYAKTFDFLSALLTPADAYIALSPLVMAAYRTTWPVHSFISLLAKTLAHCPAPPATLGSDRYWLFLQLMLEDALDTGRTPEPRRHLHEEDEQRRIDRSAVLAMAAGMPGHPMSAIVSLAYENEASIDRLEEAILHPYLAFDRRARDAHEWLQPFRPAVTAFRMFDAGMSPAETVLYISPTVVNGTFQPGEANWQEHLIQLMQIKTFVFAVATPFLKAFPHTCPHTECGFHELDLCRGWMNIPEEWRACTFPKWLENVMNRQVDADRKMLLPVD